MIKYRLGVLSLLLLPVGGHAQEEEVVSFRAIALAVLGQQVQGIGVADSQGVVEQIAQESGLDQTEVRGKLVELLDELDNQRRGKTEVWKSLVTAGGDEVAEKKADKFLKEMDKAMRKVLKKEGAYALEPLVNKAARKAKMPTYQGKDFLVLLLNPGVDETMPTVELPDKIGLLVAGESKYAIDRTAFESILITASDRLNQNKVRNVHKPITKVLAPELEGSGFVKWALGRPNPKLTPDCRLDFEIDWFSTKTTMETAQQAAAPAPGSGEGQLPNEEGAGGQQAAGGQQSSLGRNVLPKVYLNARFVMTHLESGVIVFSKSMEFNYDFENESDARIQGMRLLDNFYQKIAREATREVNQFLAGE